MPAVPCIQPTPGREQGVLVAVLGEAPAGAVVVDHGAGDEGVAEHLREDEVVVLAAPLPGVEEDVTDPRGAAAAAVVVPEAGAQPLGDAGGADAVQAASLPLGGRLPRDGFDACVLEGGEEQRGAGRAVAPGVGHLVRVRVSRDLVREHEATVAACRRA